MDQARTFVPTERTTLKRLPQRGAYDYKTIFRILDEGFICHVGFTFHNQPVVMPMAYGRAENMLYIHGSAGSRLLRELANGIPMCVTVTLLDGLVLARSAFHHSMNYRSVVLFGTADRVKDTTRKLQALQTISDHIMQGRWADVRRPNEAELRQTLVLELPVVEASAKVRSGPPIDEENDYALPVWAGELPVSLVGGQPVADPRLVSGIELPDYIRSARIL
jgi:nitroimidazol reductase NimA-like FMN-containing flavoprotein (pyridoxamine 5'-phosphate oxidase superfamily)